MTTVATVLDPKDWRTGPDGAVLVSDVIRTAGVPHGAVDYAIRLGLVPVVSQARGHARRYISREDAVMVLAAAALAITSRVALATVVRAMRATQARVTPEGLVIPVSGIAA